MERYLQGTENSVSSCSPDQTHIKKSPKWPFAPPSSTLKSSPVACRQEQPKHQNINLIMACTWYILLWLPLLLSDFKKLSLQLETQCAHELEAILRTSNNRMFAYKNQINHKPFHCLGRVLIKLKLLQMTLSQQKTCAVSSDGPP